MPDNSLAESLDSQPGQKHTVTVQFDVDGIDGNHAKYHVDGGLPFLSGSGFSGSNTSGVW